MDGGGELTHHGNKKFDVNSVLQPEIQELYLSVPILPADLLSFRNQSPTKVSSVAIQLDTDDSTSRPKDQPILSIPTKDR